MTEECAAVVEIIRRIKEIEEAYRAADLWDAAIATMFCKWVAQDVLEESDWSKGYIG
jgi:hypothetical protein